MFFGFVWQSVHFQPTRISKDMRPHAQLAPLTLVTKVEAALVSWTANVSQDMLAHHKLETLVQVSNITAFK